MLSVSELLDRWVRSLCDTTACSPFQTFLCPAYHKTVLANFLPCICPGVCAFLSSACADNDQKDCKEPNQSNRCISHLQFYWKRQQKKENQVNHIFFVFFVYIHPVYLLLSDLTACSLSVCSFVFKLDFISSSHLNGGTESHLPLWRLILVFFKIFSCFSTPANRHQSFLFSVCKALK